MAEEYGSEPADRQRNVIHDIPVFIGRVSRAHYPATPGPRPTSIRSGSAIVRAKRGAPAAAPAQPARSSVIIG
jgi:hypothetical protein